MAFFIPGTLQPGSDAALAQSYFSGGYDRTPFPTQLDRKGSAITFSKSQNESSALSVPWPVPGFGFPIIATATLRERPESYRLKVELARGKLNQLRNTVAEWESQGLKPSALVQADYAGAQKSFCKAVQTQQSSEADAASLDCLQRAFRAGAGYIRQFTETAINLRMQRERRITTRWSCRITRPPSLLLATEFSSTFTAVDIRPNWAEIEPKSAILNWDALDRTIDWVESVGLRPTIGPIIDLAGPLPDWLNPCAGEVPNLAAMFCDFIESIVNRYRNRVKHWVLCSGFNHADRLGLGEDDRVRLVVRMLEAARSTDPDSRWVVGLSSPWGEYLKSEEYTYSPLVFADTLLRSGLPIAGFELEIFAGPGAQASLLHDGLDVVRLLDLFSLLGVPVDLVARHPGQFRNGPASNPGQFNNCWLGSDSVEAQHAWGEWLSAISLCFPHVRSFIWSEWEDSAGQSPCGLVTVDHRPKPLITTLRNRRTSFL